MKSIRVKLIFQLLKERDSYKISKNITSTFYICPSILELDLTSYPQLQVISRVLIDYFP